MIARYLLQLTLALSRLYTLANSLRIYQLRHFSQIVRVEAQHIVGNEMV